MGNNNLTLENLQPIMNTFIDNLMEKNVAKDIAENLCASVTKSLLQTKTESFTTISTTVKNTLKETIYRILTPKEDLDVLKLACANKGRKDPFKVVFIGING
jgi:signal recognition particle receptor subunit alpha